MSPDPKFSYPEHPIHFEPTDPPTPDPIVVSPALFDRLATTLGASRVEADETHQFVTFNQRVYTCALGGDGVTREWKPGDVAMVTSGDVKRDAPEACPEFETVIGVRTGMAGKHGGWNQADGHWIDDDYVYDARRLVVIDAEDREQVERLDALIDKALEGPNSPKWSGPADCLQAALREFANPTPPKPEEPTGLGAVVEDDKGVRHVRTFGGCAPTAWLGHIKEDGGERTRRWSDISAIRVLSEGVTP